MEAAAAGFATGARGAAAARTFGLDLQAAAGGVRRPRRAIPMPAAGPRGGHPSFATAPSTLYAAYGAEPRRPPRLELGRVVTEFDSALTIDSHLVAVPVTRPSPMAPARPRHEHLGCGRPVSLLPLRGARRTHSSRRSAAAVGLGGEPRWQIAAAAVGRRGRSGGFGNPYAGVPPQGRRVYAQGV
ncbi:uncharacterized protein LOC125556285 [Triticum urartu]|uniref:uncharacterized protein LOC119297552 n=1 Tax=Triticum dicoccoides TaxID=85692 RepID=UPI00188E5290|nr:uncharacterized protein LOC119297552 [Triticum dicoccoides]XP_044385211.1 uncharacterized protein LOC123107282 [Triticum aestivum]XP_048575011.1 uncharacterized protein LOC125556285 [Triticum urartu]